MASFLFAATVAAQGLSNGPEYRGQVSKLVLSPDGSRVAVVFALGLEPRRGGLAIVESGSGQVMRVLDLPGCVIELAAFSPDARRLATWRHCFPKHGQPVAALIEIDVDTGGETDLGDPTTSPVWPGRSGEPFPYFGDHFVTALAYDRAKPGGLLLLAAVKQRGGDVHFGHTAYQSPFSILTLDRGAPSAPTLLASLPLRQNDYPLQADWPPTLTSAGHLILISQAHSGYYERIVERGSTEPQGFEFAPHQSFSFLAISGDGSRLLARIFEERKTSIDHDHPADIAILERRPTAESEVTRLTHLAAGISEGALSEDARVGAFVARPIGGDDQDLRLYLIHLSDGRLIPTDVLKRIAVGRTPRRARTSAAELLSRLTRIVNSAAILDPSQVEAVLDVRLSNKDMKEGRLDARIHGDIADPDARYDNSAYYLAERDGSRRGNITLKLDTAGPCLTIPAVRSAFGSLGVQEPDLYVPPRHSFRLVFDGPDDAHAAFSIVGDRCIEEASLSQTTGRWAEQDREERRKSRNLMLRAQLRKLFPFLDR